MYPSSKRNSLKPLPPLGSALDGENQHFATPGMLQIGLASLVVGFGLVSALAMGVAGHSYQMAAAREEQAAIAHSQAQANSLSHRLETFSLKRRTEIQSIAQLALLSHEKIRASIAPQEQWRALSQYAAGYDGYQFITFSDLQGNVVVPIKGSARPFPVNRALIEQAIAQQQAVASDLVLDGITELQLVAPVVDAATGQVVGTIEAVVSTETVTAALASAATNDVANNGPAEIEPAIAFQLEENIALIMALALPIATALLAGLILFWDRQIHQILAVPPARLKSLMGFEQR